MISSHQIGDDVHPNDLCGRKQNVECVLTRFVPFQTQAWLKKKRLMHVVACTKLAYMHIGHAHSCLHSLNCEVSVRTLTFPWQRMYARLN